MAEGLRARGFAHVSVYDPFVPEFSARPQGLFDLVCCFEVVEHSPTPVRTFGQIASCLDPNGLILFSTLIQPADINQIGLDWWYIAPRNGHVSIFTRAAIAAVATPMGLNCGSFDDSIHALFRRPPDFARHLIPK